jgi:probable HAF family extracellular repeat protein
MWQNGALTELGSFGGRSGASDINASNVVVGWSYDTTGDLHGFIYKGGKLTDLNLLIDRPLTKTAKGNWVVAAEWVIHEATAINDAGVIVGRGTKDGRARAIMLKPRAGGNVVSSAELQKLIAALKPTRALAQGKDVIVPATTPDADRKTAPASSAR